MKQFILFMAFACAGLTLAAQDMSLQNQISIDGLSVKQSNASLHISWQSTTGENNYWEVQGSKDGKAFSTIGLVMGADPKGSSNSFSFKQQTEKIKAGLKYFRVIYMEKEGVGYASAPIRLTK
jgi:hypothetical protein